MASDMTRMLEKAKAGQVGDRARPEFAERPRDVFKDVRDSLERSFHMSRLAPSPEERILHLLDFFHLGVAHIKEEEVFKEEVKKSVEDNLKLPEIRLIPRFTEGQPTYDLQTNLGSGYNTHCLAPDLPFVYNNIKEDIYRETYHALLDARDKVARKLVEQKVLNWSRILSGIVIGSRRVGERRSVDRFERFRKMELLSNGEEGE